jgi:type III secretion protein J
MAVLAALAAALIGCDEPVVRNVPQRQALEIAELLGSSGIDARIEPESRSAGERTFQVRIDSARAAEARELLVAANLPREEHPGLAKALADAPLIPDERQDRLRYGRALAGDIAASLEGHPGIVQADVGLTPAEPAPAGSGKAAAAAKASVSIRYKPVAGEPPLTIEQVRQWVAGRVAGLEPAAVAVVMTPVTAPQPRGTAAGSASAEFWARPGDSRNWLVPGLSIISLIQAGAILWLILRGRRTAA